MKNVTMLGLCMILLIIAFFPISTSAQWGKALHYKWWEHDRLLVLQSVDYWPEHVYQGTVELFFKLDSTLRSDNHGNTYTYLISKNQGGAAKGDFGSLGKLVRVIFIRGFRMFPKPQLCTVMRSRSGNHAGIMLP